MNNQFNKVIVFVTVLLLFAKSKANVNIRFDEDKINYLLSEIVREAKSDSTLLIQLMLFDKTEFENELATTLNDEEYRMVRYLLGQLMTQGVSVRLTPINSMVLATQEYQGGGSTK